MSWRFVLSLLFAFAVAVFAIQNAGAVHINFLVWEGDISQALVILLSAIFGAVIVLLLSLIKQIQLSLAVKSERKNGSTLLEEKKALQAKLEQALDQIAQMKAIEETATTIQNDQEVPNQE